MKKKLRRLVTTKTAALTQLEDIIEARLNGATIKQLCEQFTNVTVPLMRQRILQSGIDIMMGVYVGPYPSSQNRPLYRHEVICVLRRLGFHIPDSK